MKQLPNYPEKLHDILGEYPSEEALDFIMNFDCLKFGFTSLAKFIEQVWRAPEWGYLMKGKRVKKLYLSTGGWPGNEDIIRSLQANFIFWSNCWLQTRRGGHYIFEIKEITQSH